MWYFAVFSVFVVAANYARMAVSKKVIPQIHHSASDLSEGDPVEVHVASARIVDAQRNAVLTLRRSESSIYNKGVWEMPCGKGKRSDRSARDTLVRELREELRMLPRHVFGHVCEVDNNIPREPSGDGKRVFVITRATMVLRSRPKIDLSADEGAHDAFCWMTAPELGAMPVISGLKPFLERGFAAIAHRGTILDCIPGLNLSTLPMLLGDGGRRIFVPSEGGSELQKLGPDEHIEDHISDVFKKSFTAKINARSGCKRALLKMDMPKPDKKSTRPDLVQAEMCWLVHGAGISSQIPPRTSKSSSPLGRWVTIESPDFHALLSNATGFRKKALQALQNAIVRQRPAWTDWLSRNSLDFTDMREGGLAR